MPNSLVAIGGVLVSFPDTENEQSKQDIEYSILLAWLAAVKAAPHGVVRLADLVATLQKVGWTTSAGATEDSSAVALAELSAHLMSRAITDADQRQYFEEAFGNKTGRDADTVATWAAALGNSDQSPAILAYLGSDEGPTVNFATLFAKTPSHLDVIVSTPSVVATTIRTQTLVLNPDVYTGVRQAVADKVKPHLDQIVSSKAA